MAREEKTRDRDYVGVAVAGAGYSAFKKVSLLIWAVLNFMMTILSYSCPSIADQKALNGPRPMWKFPTDMN